jgi:hypothetical protein
VFKIVRLLNIRCDLLDESALTWKLIELCQYEGTAACISSFINVPVL